MATIIAVWIILNYLTFFPNGMVRIINAASDPPLYHLLTAT